MDKNNSMTIDTIPGLRALTLSPDYRNALKLPEKCWPRESTISTSGSGIR